MSDHLHADLSGRIFDKLTATHHVRGEGHALGILWFCRCACSPYATMEVWSHKLLSGEVRDCGCREKARNRKRVERKRKTKRDNGQILFLAKLCNFLHVTSVMKRNHKNKREKREISD